MSDRNTVTIRIQELGLHLCIKVIGRLGHSNIGDFTSVLWRFVEEHTQKFDAVVMDLTEMESIDSTGLATLIHVHQKVAPLHMYGLDKNLFAMFNQVGLVKVFNIYGKLDEALKVLG